MLYFHLIYNKQVSCY